MKKEDFSQILDQVAKEWVIDTIADGRGRHVKEENYLGPNPSGYPIVVAMKPCMGICGICDDVVENPHWQHLYDPMKEAWNHKCLNCGQSLPDKVYRNHKENK